MFKIYSIGLCLALTAAIISCKKNELRLTQFELPADKAYVRFGLFSPNTPAVMIKVNDVKINGASTGGNGGFFPSTANFPDYSAIIPISTVKLSLPNTGTGNDSVVIYSGALTLEPNKFYALTLADTTTDRTLFAIEDQISLADSGFFKLRIINAMPKSPAINLIRIDSTSPTVVIRDTIAKNIAYKSASGYITTSISPLASNTSTVPVTYYTTLRFRVTNTAGQVIGSGSTSPLAIATSNKRSFTFYTSGFANGTGTLAPVLTTFIYNK